MWALILEQAQRALWIMQLWNTRWNYCILQKVLVMRVRGDGGSSISIQAARFTHWNWMACSSTCAPALLTNRQTNSKNPTSSLRQQAVLTNIQALQSLRCFQRHGWNMTESEQAAMLKMDITNSWLLPYYCSKDQTFSCHCVHRRGVILVNRAAPWQQTLKHSPQTFISFCLAKLDSNLLRQSRLLSLLLCILPTPPIPHPSLSASPTALTASEIMKHNRR